MTTSSRSESGTQTTNSYLKPQSRPYGKIVLTLKNVLLPEDKLSVTPSELDGLDKETEIDLRIYGCELIQTAGILLKLPQVAMASGQVLLQRFYYSKSFVRQPVEQTAMACVCLASKIEEAPRRVRDIISVFMHMRQVNCNKAILPVILDQPYIHLKNQVIKAERRVLKELGFSVHIKHPHKIIVMYLQVLNHEKDQKLMQFSWNYMNDSLRTDVFVRYQPETVACACIYLTARKLRIALPKTPAWYTLFGVTEEQIQNVCYRILRLYNRPKVNVEALEKKVEELVKKYQEAKLKARGGSGNNTPSNNSPKSPSGANKTTGAHNAWGGFISRSGFHAPSSINTTTTTKHSPQSPTHNSLNHSPTNQPPNGTNPTSASQSQSTNTKHNSQNTTNTTGSNNNNSRGSKGTERRDERDREPGGRKRSRTRSPPGSKGRYKKTAPGERDRERGNGRERDREVRRKSYSRSRSSTPVKNSSSGGISKKNRQDKRRSSRSPSNDRENNRSNVSNKYDKYDRYESKYDSKYDTSSKYDTKGDGKYHNSGSKYRMNSSGNTRGDRDRSKERNSKDGRRR